MQAQWRGVDARKDHTGLRGILQVNALELDPADAIDVYYRQNIVRQRLTKFKEVGGYGAFALSEPEAGSDASNQHTTAIKDGDVYFQKRHGYGGWGSELKFCAACTAMILYCRDVDDLPPAYFTHWDSEKKKPVHKIEKSDD